MQALQGVEQHPGIYPVEARSIPSASVTTLSSDIAKYLLGDRSTPGREAPDWSNIISYAKQLSLALNLPEPLPHCWASPSLLSSRNVLTHSSHSYLLLRFHVSASTSPPQDPPRIVPLNDALTVTCSFPRQQDWAY